MKRASRDEATAQRTGSLRAVNAGAYRSETRARSSRLGTRFLSDPQSWPRLRCDPAERGHPDVQPTGVREQRTHLNRSPGIPLAIPQLADVTGSNHGTYPTAPREKYDHENQAPPPAGTGFLRARRAHRLRQAGRGSLVPARMASGARSGPCITAPAAGTAKSGVPGIRSIRRRTRPCQEISSLPCATGCWARTTGTITVRATMSPMPTRACCWRSTLSC